MNDGRPFANYWGRMSAVECVVGIPVAVGGCWPGKNDVGRAQLSSSDLEDSVQSSWSWT